MQFDPMKPIWLQVATALKTRLVRGEIPPGGKLPSGREMAVEYGINPNTAARVYQEMEKEGACFTKRGMGTFATDDAARIEAIRTEMAEGLISSFFEGAAQLGLDKEKAIKMLLDDAKDA